MGEENDDKQQDPPKAFTPITSQEEFDKALGPRLERERGKYADYDELKTKASEFDKVQEASKTELQKLQERAEQAERRATESEQVALRTRIAAETGVPIEVLNGTDETTIRASAQRVVEWRDSNRKTPPPPKKLSSGAAPPPATGEQGRAAAALRALRQG